jgi:colanic acid/amylovoran biosynthesis protein
VKKSFDLVLKGDSYNLDYIFRNIPTIKKINIKPDSVGIVPSIKLFNYKKTDEIYSTFKEIIDELLALKKNVYIFNHSIEDIGVCSKIKSLYLNNEKVIFLQDDFNAIELEEIIKQFDFIIASRYHSIIHAFKNGTPALVIGWADKYNDLLKNFNQLDYHIDVKNFLDKDNTLIKLEKIIKNFNQESKCILTKMNEIKKDSII